MVRAILFDMGGTLDGDGLHWLDRFVALYRDLGVELPKEAFYEAERRASYDEEIASADFKQMIELHVKWQFGHLGLTNETLRKSLIAGFSEPVRKAAAANALLLAELAERGFALGVVSNGCGNVDLLCADFGYSPFLSTIVDSRRVAVSKPDPAIFVLAAQDLGLPHEEIMMVGDSFDRDVRPAKKIGMKTAWLEGIEPRDCPDPSLIDLRLRTLADLREALVNCPAFA
jgi:HAD superfamily hydrolase (TIGR01509 family)